MITKNASALLASRAMLAGVKIGMFSGRKLDKRITDEVNRQHDAESDAGRFNKLIVDKAVLAPVERVQAKARGIQARYTLPWLDNGLDILPAASLTAYQAEMKAVRLEFEAAADAVADAWPAAVEAARTRLARMFDPNDYPEAREVRARYRFRVRLQAMPDASADFRVQVSEEQADMIRADLAADAEEALREASRAAFQRIADVVRPMAEKLAAFKPAAGKGDKSEGVFRDSLVGNVRDLVAMLPAFNLANDPVLADITAKLAARLCQHDADELRDNVLLRRDTMKEAESILSDLADFL